MSTVPINFVTLHEEEERLRNLALQTVHEADLAVHLEVTHRAMDVLDMLRQHFLGTDDERAISHLGVRAFNSFASALKLALSGYYQASAMVLRDVIETSELVEFFSLDRAHVAAWRGADRETLVRSFGPSKIREALDKAEGVGKDKSKRARVYQKLSHLAAHPSVDGFAMLRPKGMDSRCGPFGDYTVLRAVLEEMGILAVRTGFAFGPFLDTRVAACQRNGLLFLRSAMAYTERFYGQVYSAEDRAMVENAFAPPP